jgi:hypothetical protein
MKNQEGFVILKCSTKKVQTLSTLSFADEVINCPIIEGNVINETANIIGIIQA